MFNRPYNFPILQPFIISTMRALFFCFFFIISLSVHALDPKLSLKLGKADINLAEIEIVLQKNNETDVSKLQQFLADSIKIQSFANECVIKNETSIRNSADALELLGLKTSAEEKIISKKRASLNKNMLSSAQQLATCRLMLLRTKETIKASEEQYLSVIENKLFTQRTTAFDHITYNVLNPLFLLTEIKDFLLAQIDLEQLSTHKYKLLFIVALSLLISFAFKKWLKSYLNKKQYNENLSLGGQMQLAVMSCTNHYIPLLLTSSLLTLYLFITYQEIHNSFLTILMANTSLLILFIWLIRIFLNPCLPAKTFLNVDVLISQVLSKRLRVLVWILFVGVLFFYAIKVFHFNENTQGLLTNIFIAFVVLNLIWITFILGEFNALANTILIRMVLVASLLTSLFSNWLGYANLSLFILIGLSGTVLLLLTALFMSRLFTDFIDGFDEGRYQWQKKARKVIGVKEDAYIPGVVWIRFSINIIIWSLAVVLALKTWGLSDKSLLELKTLVLDGFTIGSIQIIPTRILISLLSFSVMISFVGWVKRRLDKSWLNRSRMDRGTKEAMISLTGYVGMAIAFIVTLSIAGVQLANLAIVAGALSVGIGFGLQNIVNNFISGVILLFERPIKTGDWVSVGATEGYVRKISIRSTQIQTFDRSDVLVPNSEFISGQVTNWMLKDSRGRLVVPVGVAYGTDAEKVKNLLLGIAYNHDQIIKNSPILSDPYVLFKEFADSSLNFELRCFLVDVDTRLRVLSDINFEINRLFIEHKIEIPFPQRDLNIKHGTLFPKDEDS